MPTNEMVSKKIEYGLDWMRIKDEELYFGPNNKEIVLEFEKPQDRTS